MNNEELHLGPSLGLIATMVYRLQSEFSTLNSDLTTEEHQTAISDGIKAGHELGITSTSLLYRYLRLRYIDARLWARRGSVEVAMAVLMDDSTDVEERIEFIERAILGIKANKLGEESNDLLDYGERSS